MEVLKQVNLESITKSNPQAMRILEFISITQGVPMESFIEMFANPDLSEAQGKKSRIAIAQLFSAGFVTLSDVSYSDSKTIKYIELTPLGKSENIVWREKIGKFQNS